MQKTRVGDYRFDRYDIYIGRPSKWANKWSTKKSKFDVIKVDTKEEAIRLYAEELLRNTGLMEEVSHTLRGKTLGCFCKRVHDNGKLVCHGQVLAYVADNYNYQEMTVEEILANAGQY